MYDKILVPLDGSAAAEIALPYVQEIAARSGAEVHLVSVMAEMGPLRVRSRRTHRSSRMAAWGREKTNRPATESRHSVRPAIPDRLED